MGAWEDVEYPLKSVQEDAVQTDEVKRKFEDDEDDHESFKIRDKRVRDVYADQDWDPKRTLSGLKLKVKEERAGRQAVQETETPTGLDRTGWSGKLELGADPLGSNGDVVREKQVDAEVNLNSETTSAVPVVNEEDLVKPTVGPNSLFRKRRSRK